MTFIAQVSSHIVFRLTYYGCKMKIKDDINYDIRK
jgi:hypothetical protein